MPTIPGIIYRLEFLNAEAVTVRIDITPLDIQIPDTDLPTVIPLTGGAQPVIISSINTDQDKFQPIRSKQAVIQFVSGNAIDITTFSQGSDNNWKVDITETTFAATVIFTGYLILADNQMPFQPVPQYVVLTATDHLGAVKEIPWVDYTDGNPSGKYRVADIITQCLRKTGLSLPLNVVNNLRIGSGEYTVQAFFSQADQHILIPTGTPNAYFYPGQVIAVTGTVSNNVTFHVESASFSGVNTTVLIRETITITELALATVFTDQASSNHWYDITLIEAKTFEDQIGTCINCYDVLSRIFGEDCFVTQWKGEWWAYRVDEMEGNPVYVAHFDTAGLWTGTDAGIQIDKSIGASQFIKFANADTILRFIRPHGSVQERFDYEVPLEVPCNVDFERGAVIDDTSSTEKTYVTECWPLRRLFGQPITSLVFTKRIFVNDYETERYLVMTPSTSPATPWTFAEADPIPVSIGDKINISVSFRFASDIGAGGAVTYNPLRLYLRADNGDLWYYWHPSSSVVDEFYWTGPEAIEQERSIPAHWILSDTDESEWQNLTVETKALPATGRLYIGLNQMNQTASAGDNVDINYNFTLEILAFINGSYRRYTAQSNEINRTATGYFPKRETQVYISDSPRAIFKGAMFFLSDYSEIWNDTVDFFAAFSSFQVAGYQIGIFRPGMNIRISGTASNNITTKIISSSYSLIGDLTSVVVDGTLVDESVTAVIEEALYSLVQNWFSAQQIGNLLNTDPARLHPYGYIQAYSVWNQFRGSDDPNNARGMGLCIFSGSLKGLSAFTNWPDLLYRVTLVDANPQTNDRYFILISLSIDWKSAIWTGTFIEVQNYVIGKIYSDPLTFKYITS